MNETEYLSLCRLSTDNYLQLENVLFKFADTVYVYDDWENKGKIFTMQLANLYGSICSGIEEAIKLFLVNPKNNLIKNFISYIDTLPINENYKKDIKKDLEGEILDNVKLKWILDFNGFREKLNEFSGAVIFSKPPFEISFQENFGEQNTKPRWFDIYEGIKHNFFSKYPGATLEIVFEALAAYYLIARMLANEATFIVQPEWQSGYYTWYEANICADRSLHVGASENDIQHFKSKHFEALSLRKNSK